MFKLFNKELSLNSKEVTGTKMFEQVRHHFETGFMKDPILYYPPTPHDVSTDHPHDEPHLCRGQVYQAGQVLPLRGGQILLLLESPLQLVNLEIIYLLDLCL